MRIPAHTHRIQVALALFVSLLVVLWWTAVPDRLSLTSYVLVSGLLAAIAAVAAISYNNSQSTGSLAQILHEADVAGTPAPIPASGSERKPRQES